MYGLLFDHEERVAGAPAPPSRELDNLQWAFQSNSQAQPLRQPRNQSRVTGFLPHPLRASLLAPLQERGGDCPYLWTASWRGASASLPQGCPPAADRTFRHAKCETQSSAQTGQDGIRRQTAWSFSDDASLLHFHSSMTSFKLPGHCRSPLDDPLISVPDHSCSPTALMKTMTLLLPLIARTSVDDLSYLTPGCARGKEGSDCSEVQGCLPSGHRTRGASPFDRVVLQAKCPGVKPKCVHPLCTLYNEATSWQC